MNADLRDRVTRAAFACWIIAAIPALLAVLGLLFDLRILVIAGSAWAVGLAVLGALFLKLPRLAVVLAMMAVIGMGVGGVVAAVRDGGRPGFLIPFALLAIAAPRLVRLHRDLRYARETQPPAITVSPS